jgi:methylenetetrahydrofolate reductase (NADPH)
LAEYKSQNPNFNIEQVHFYPLGGTKTTARWAENI